MVELVHVVTGVTGRPEVKCFGLEPAWQIVMEIGVAGLCASSLLISSSALAAAPAEWRR